MKKVLYIACDDNGIVESSGMDITHVNEFKVDENTILYSNILDSINNSFNNVYSVSADVYYQNNIVKYEYDSFVSDTVFILRKLSKEQYINEITNGYEAVKVADKYPILRFELVKKVSNLNEAILWVKKFPELHDILLPMIKSTVNSTYIYNWILKFPMDKFIFYNVAYLGGNLELASKLVKRFPEDLMEIEKFFKSDSLSNEDLLKWESFKNGLDI